MKYITVWAFALLSLLPLARATPSADDIKEAARIRDFELQEVAFWKDKLNQSLRMGPVEKLEFLSVGLKNMGNRASRSDSQPEVEEIFGELQKTMMEIPGHAHYFAESLEKKRAGFSEVELSRSANGEYDLDREMYILGVISRLPTPESLSVLGNYLYDERDIDEPHYAGQDSFRAPPNACLATAAIGKMGLRQPPVAKIENYPEWREEHAKTLAWWEQVKSGQRSFSFIGQNVEYRFKPDGSVESFPYIGLPDPPKLRLVRKVVPDLVIDLPTSSPWPRVGIVAGILTLLALILGWLRRGKSPGGLQA